MMVIVQRHVVSCLGESCLRLFNGRFYTPDKVVRCFDVGWSCWLEPHARVSSAIKVERRELRRGVDMIVVRELGKREQVVPIVLSFVDEEA